MDKVLCPACSATAEPRRIRADASGMYATCSQCGAEIRIDLAENERDPVTGEEIVGVREHMPRGAAD